MRGIITSRFIHTLAERERGRRWWFTHMLCNGGGVTVVLFVPEYDDGHLDFRLFSHSLAQSLALTPTRNQNHLSTNAAVAARARVLSTKTA